MIRNTLICMLFSMLYITIGCEENTAPATNAKTNQTDNYQMEKAAILEVLNGETMAAFSRDYEAWKTKWVHKDYVSKTYMNFAEDSMSETLGWKEIDDFVRTYIEEHPEPDPLPPLLEDIDVRLYGNGAWIDYEQTDPGRGLKRETRLMEKENGQWKIAGMQTIIYGFGSEE